MIPEYTQKIKDWPVPKSSKEVATFLGFAEYSGLTNWLNWINKAEKFLWNEEIEQDFIELKKAFTEGGIQAFPDFGEGNPFILTTDWSKENITGVLSQVQDRQDKFLGCWGRKCNKYKGNCPSYKVELLAVIQCIKKWKHILSYRLFEVHTDASALKYLTTMKNQSGLFTRWYQELDGFNFTVIHTKEKENSNTDALSRSSHLVEAPPLV